MTRKLTLTELAFAEHLCHARIHLEHGSCPTCRADVVRLVDGDGSEIEGAQEAQRHVGSAVVGLIRATHDDSDSKERQATYEESIRNLIATVRAERLASTLDAVDGDAPAGPTAGNTWPPVTLDFKSNDPASPHFVPDIPPPPSRATKGT